MQTENFFSINRAASLLGHTRRTIKAALRGVAPDTEEDGVSRWSMDKIVAALKDVGTAESGELTKERVHRERVARQRSELRLAVERGEFVSVKSVVATVEPLFSTIREKILSRPGRLADRLANRPRAEIENILREDAVETLTELNAIKLEKPSGVGV